MEWLKEQTKNPMFLLAVAVVVIAVYIMYGAGSLKVKRA